MLENIKCGLGIVFLLTFFNVHSEAEVIPKSNRMIGFSVSEGNVGYDRALSVAQEAGLEFVELPLSWDDIETGPGKYGNQYLEIAELFYPKAHIKVLLSINTIDTNNLRLPPYLKKKKFDDPQVIEQYKKLLDYVFSRIPSLELIGITIGNEVDKYLGKDPKKWQQYQHFVQDIVAYIKQKRPDLPVGVKATMDGYTEANVDELKDLNQFTDAVFVTYYPLAGDLGVQLKVKEPAAVHQDFDKIISLYPNKKIFMTEIGYPSSEYLKSSNKKQAEFIREVFKAWDRYGEQIPFMNFVWLHDTSQADLDHYAKYYGSDDKGFMEFLGSLGLRTYEGEDKEAFKTLKVEAKLRQWPVKNSDSPDRLEEDTDLPGKTESPEIKGAQDVQMGFKSKEDLLQCSAGEVQLMDEGPNPASRSMLWEYRYKNDWLWCQKKSPAKQFSGKQAVHFWMRSNHDSPIFLRLDETSGESFYVTLKPAEIWQQYTFPVKDFQLDRQTKKNKRLEMDKVAVIMFADGFGVDQSAYHSRQIWISDFILD